MTDKIQAARHDLAKKALNGAVPMIDEKLQELLGERFGIVLLALGPDEDDARVFLASNMDKEQATARIFKAVAVLNPEIMSAFVKSILASEEGEN